MAEIYRSPSEKEKKKRKPSSSRKLKVRKEVYRLIGKTINPLASFVARPKNLSFESQLDQEEIILLLRRHWITNLPWMGATFLLLLFPFFLFPFFLSFLPLRFQLVGVMMWYLFVLAFVLEKFLGWYFNVYIITDERVVDIDFVSLVYKRISDAEISMIQDVTYQVGGIVRTMFNFGDVFIQTAAEKPQFEFNDVPNPALVVKVLQKLRIEERQEELEGRVR